MQLQALYPSTFAKLFSNNEMVGIYSANLLLALEEGGITSIEQIERGLAAVRAKEDPFAPSVGEFVKMCKEPVKHASHVPALPSPPESVEDKKRRMDIGRRNIKDLMRKVRRDF